MSPRLSSIAGLSMAALLSACGQNGGGGPTSTSAPEPLGPPVPAPTEAQAKAMIASLPAPYNTGDPVNGKVAFARCRSCHTTGRDETNGIGPNLFGLFGRKAASRPGFAYSDALKKVDWSWDAQHLDKWIENPRAYVEGTKMNFIGLREAKDRVDVIAYLKTVTEVPPGAEPAKADTDKAAPAKP
jgi:cytochrome c